MTDAEMVTLGRGLPSRRRGGRRNLQTRRPVSSVSPLGPYPTLPLPYPELTDRTFCKFGVGENNPGQRTVPPTRNLNLRGPKRPQETTVKPPTPAEFDTLTRALVVATALVGRALTGPRMYMDAAAEALAKARFNLARLTDRCPCPLKEREKTLAETSLKAADALSAALDAAHREADLRYAYNACVVRTARRLGESLAEHDASLHLHLHVRTTCDWTVAKAFEFGGKLVDLNVPEVWDEVVVSYGFAAARIAASRVTPFLRRETPPPAREHGFFQPGEEYLGTPPRWVPPDRFPETV